MLALNRHVVRPTDQRGLFRSCSSVRGSAGADEARDE